MKTLSLVRLAALCLCAVPAISGCEKNSKEVQSGPPPAIITVTQAVARDVPVVEHSIGEIDSVTTPKIGAEVAGRITKVLVDVGDPVTKGQLLAEIDATDYVADARRLKSDAVTQQKLATRYRELARKGFVSSSSLEGIETQNISAREQYARAAKNVLRTRIESPVDGRVDSRFVSKGDWIDLGKPVFQIATSQALRIRLPFPETVSHLIKVGQTVKLSTPTAPGEEINGTIAQLRPMVGADSRSFDAIVEIDNPGDWRPGSSVNGEVLLETHSGAVTVPEESIVLRPAGDVAYVVADGKALQRVVKTGVKQEGYVEIIDGLRVGESVAVDGAGYLTDQGRVEIKQATPAAEPAK
ncbi:MAG: efflux RND transporter periplasmic adaptor subunit [Sulfuricella sp.]